MEKPQARDLLLILLSAALLFGFGAALWLRPHESFSEEENRALTTLSPPSLGEVADGSFFRAFSLVASDQFPLRARWIALKAEVERLLGKKENNGILFGKDGILIPRGEYASLTLAEENLAAIRSFSAETGVPTHTLVIPRHVDLLTDSLPTFFSTERASALSELLTAESGILFPLAEWQNRSELLYKTDHHQTTEGAYAAYSLLRDSLGYVPMGEDFFEKVAVSEDFRGTSHAKAGGSSLSSDRITLYRYDGDENVTVENPETGHTEHGFYRWDALSEKDQYKVFFGGNHARLELRAPVAEERPRLLLIKDSYANAILPFLAIHFDVTVVDPRYGQVSPLDLASYDQILLLFGADTLATDPAPRKLALLSP